MSPRDLLYECATAERNGSLWITLVVPRGFKAPPGFPRGELLCENSANERVRRYSVAKMRAWVERQPMADTGEVA